MRERGRRRVGVCAQAGGGRAAFGAGGACVHAALQRGEVGAEPGGVRERGARPGVGSGSGQGGGAAGSRSRGGRKERKKGRKRKREEEMEKRKKKRKERRERKRERGAGFAATPALGRPLAAPGRA